MSRAAEHPGKSAGAVTIVMTLLGWSSVPLFLKHFSHSIDAWTSNGWRYGFSALLWGPLVLFLLSRGRMPAGIWRRALVPSVFNSLGQVLFTWAHYKIHPGLLTFGLRTQIVFVATGAFLLFPGERRVIRAKAYWLGVAMILGGTAGTVFGGKALPRLDEALGIGFALLAGMCFACYSLSVRYFMHGYRSAASFSVISQYTAAVMVLLMVLLGEQKGWKAASLPAGQIVLLLVSAVIGIALGHLFYYISIARLGVAVSSAVLQLQPICVAMASRALFGELLTPLQWSAGAVAVMGALAILETQRRLTQAAPQAAEP